MVYSSDRMPWGQRRTRPFSLSQALFFPPLDGCSHSPASTLPALSFSSPLQLASCTYFVASLVCVCLSCTPLLEEKFHKRRDCCPLLYLYHLRVPGTWQMLHKNLSTECIKEGTDMEKSLKSILKWRKQNAVVFYSWCKKLCIHTQPCTYTRT